MLKDDLIKIQNELKCPKDQYNSFGDYKYRSFEQILEAVKPLLCAAVCAVSWAVFAAVWQRRVQKERERELDKRDRIVRDLLATQDFYSAEVRHDD